MGIVPGTPWCGVLIVKLHCEEQLEIVILALLHILTLCKCDSFPWVNTSKFHSLWEEKWVPNPPVTHSQILKLHLLVKKKKQTRFIHVKPLCKHKNRSARPDKSLFKVSYGVKVCAECFQAFKALGKEWITQRAWEWEIAYIKQLEVHIQLLCCYG